jgi:hypothetical protein
MFFEFLQHLHPKNTKFCGLLVVVCDVSMW